MTPEQIAQLTGASWTFIGTVFLAVIGFIANYLIKRMRNRASEPDMWLQLDKLSVEVYGDGKTPGLKERLTAAEERARLADRKAAAIGRIIVKLAEQWQGPAPKLDPHDLAMLDETILPATHWWREKPPKDVP